MKHTIILILAVLSTSRYGATATYRLVTDGEVGGGHVATLSVAWSTQNGRSAVSMHATPTEGAGFGVWFLGRGAQALLTGVPNRDLTPIARYLLRTSSGQTLDFVDRRTNRAFPPMLLAQGHLVPRCLDNQGKFLPHISFLGRRYVLADKASDGATINVPARVRSLVLDDDVLIGTSRNFRNAVRGRSYNPQTDYAYVDFGEADYAEMCEAGMNYFDRVGPKQYRWVERLPCFFDVGTFKEGGVSIPFPEVLYHSGFRGVEDFVDEPAYLMVQQDGFAGLQGPRYTLEWTAQQLEQRVRRLYSEGGDGRPVSLAERLAQAGIVLPGLVIVEDTVPIWEEYFSTACYQLRAGGSGFIHEGRYDFPYVPGILNETYRTRIPMKPESVFLIYYAFLRGAARVYNRDWGTAIYGQADPYHAPMGLRMAYDRGAKYLWFWTSDSGHHLPYDEQLSLVRQVREHIGRHPRPPRDALTRQAEVAIVLPYGFTFPISDWEKRHAAPLWHMSAFGLEDGRLPSGVPYYTVLRQAAVRMEELIRAGREFDVVIDVPELTNAGYRQVLRVFNVAPSDDSRFPHWICWKQRLLLALPIAYLLIATIAHFGARRLAVVKYIADSPRLSCLLNPWRALLPFALFLALKHHVLSALRLEDMYTGPQRNDWVLAVYVVAVIVPACFLLRQLWRKRARTTPGVPAWGYLASSALAFAIEYRLFLWLARGDIIA